VAEEPHSEGLTRADLEGLPPRRLRSDMRWKADLLLYRVGGEDILLKDHRAQGRLWRNVLGALSIRKEARALAALAGMPYVPQIRGRPDRFSLAMTYVPATRIPDARLTKQAKEEFVLKLERAVAEMHRRGVVHLDLRHRSNLMVSADSKPLMLDFEGAFTFSMRWFPGRLAVGLLGQFDEMAVRNWKRKLAPQLLSKSELLSARLVRRLRGLWLPRRIIDAFVSIFGGRS
jgi:hypothetical protein